MKTKDKLIQVLEARPNQWISGEQLADSFMISRAAIWKAVNALRSEGYVIDAVRSTGYRLVTDADILSELGIFQYLSPECRELDIQVIPEVSSTNKLLKEKADTGSQEGTVLIAGMQTEGRGRMGRRFYSPADTGVYMSILLHPKGLIPSKALQLTAIAAVAACEAINSISGKNAEIKWVNDVYLEGKKVCGILTEGAGSLESGCLDYAILGVGINVYRPEQGFPADIEDTAGYIFEEKISNGKNMIAASYLNHFMKYYQSGIRESHIEEYRKRNLVIGREIEVLNGGNRKAFAVDIDDDCQLIVRFEDGTIEHLPAGEISVRL